MTPSRPGLRARAWHQRLDNPAPVFFAGNIGNVAMPGLIHYQKLPLSLRRFINFDTHSEWHDSVPPTVRHGNRHIELRDNALRIEVNSGDSPPDNYDGRPHDESRHCAGRGKRGLQQQGSGWMKFSKLGRHTTSERMTKVAHTCAIDTECNSQVVISRVRVEPGTRVGGLSTK